MAPTDAQAARVAGDSWAPLEALGSVVLGTNPFYQSKFAAAGLPAFPPTLAEFIARVPFTQKAELVANQADYPPYGTDLTFAIERYTRCHQTSGTRGAPLRWLDTPESWAAMTDDWVEVFRAAGIGPGDRILFAFSFGPFLGFWLAFEAGQRVGALCFAGGGMSSAVRLRVLLENECTVLCCTPTYALHLAEIADAEGIELSRSRIQKIVVAGEPGGSLSPTRERLGKLWHGARVFDHHGMTETGPVSVELPDQPGRLTVLTQSFFAEVIDPATGTAIPKGETGELVLTTLRRGGSPLIRYRTGDLVRPRNVPVSNQLMPRLVLEGGILGRLDDMVIVRGVNVYPTAIEEIVRSLPEVGEYRVTLDSRGTLTELGLEAETSPAVASELARRLHQALALRISVTTVPPRSLPRFEHKANRWRRL